MLAMENNGAGGRGAQRAVGERRCAGHDVEIGGGSPGLGP
jgi:hypothetical protein